MFIIGLKKQSTKIRNKEIPSHQKPMKNLMVSHESLTARRR